MTVVNCTAQQGFSRPCVLCTSIRTLLTLLERHSREWPTILTPSRYQ